MKITIFLLLFALGAMWYRGDLSDIIQQRPEQLGLPSASQIPSLPEIAIPAVRDFGTTIREESRTTSTQQFIVQDNSIKPKTLDEIEKTGDVRGWISSHEIKQERNEIDKLMNFLARGKYE